MSTILLKTKIHIPTLRAEHVSRSRLIIRLEQGTQGKLTLVSAQAGFGKTTLISSWIKKSKMPTAWFSVDKDDNDAYRFWFYFANALHSIDTNFGKKFLGALTASQTAPNEDLIGSLISQIEDSHSHFAVVIDDFHLIENPKIQTQMMYLLTHIPEQMHLIISSRSDPPWPLARLRAQHELTEIRANELRFRFDETRALLNEIMDLAISKDNISRLENRTEGWIVGLQMVAISMQNREDISSFIQAFTGTHRFILDYLLEEVLNQQSPEIQEFLLKTSILDQLTSPLCDAVLGGSSSQEILAQLELSNLFLIPLDDERIWYRYHHLFSELLRNQLTLIYPAEISNLHQKTSEWLEAQGFIDETVAHAFAAQDHERAARLCEKFGLGMLQESRHKALSNWIEALPIDLVHRRPWLCVYQSWTRHWAGLREDGEACLENAERMLENTSERQEDESRRLSGSIATVRAHYALVNEHLPEAIEQALKAQTLLSKTDFYVLGTAGVALGGAYWGQGKTTQAEQAFQTCAHIALKGGYVSRASSALCYMSMQQIFQARLKQAEITLQQALDIATGDEGQLLPVAGYPLAKLGELACEWNHLDQALEYSEKGLKLCKLLGHVDLIAKSYAALARVRLARADHEGVQNILEQADQLALETKLDPWAITWLEDCRIRLWLSTGKLDQATRWVARSGIDPNGELSFHHDLHHLILVRVMIANIAANTRAAAPDQCLQLVDRLLSMTDEMNWRHHNIQTLVLKALALHSINDLNGAIQTLNQALSLAEPQGYIRIFVQEGEMLEALLQQVHSRRKNDTYTKILLSAFAKELASPQSGLVEPLSPREIEILNFLTTSLSVPEIANELTISSNTVRSHIKSIYGKLEVNRRLDAIEKAKKLQLV